MVDSPLQRLEKPFISCRDATSCGLLQVSVHMTPCGEGLYGLYLQWAEEPPS